jgi:hypothetical protein
MLEETRNENANGNVVVAAPSSPKKPCAFFAQGTCRNGNECRFSHSQQIFNTPPPPIMINIPPGQPVFSIDVECVATGIQHNARSIAQVALVDEWSRPMFNVFIKQDVPVVSYIEPLTGLNKEILDQYGLPLGSIFIHDIVFFLSKNPKL